MEGSSLSQTRVTRRCTMSNRIRRLEKLMQQFEQGERAPAPRSRIPRWAATALIGAGITLGSIACQPPAAENNGSTNNLNNVNNQNNQNNQNNANDGGVDSDVTDNVFLYGVPDDGGTDIQEDVPPVDTLYGVPDAQLDASTDAVESDAVMLYGKSGD